MSHFQKGLDFPVSCTESLSLKVYFTVFLHGRLDILLQCLVVEWN